MIKLLFITFILFFTLQNTYGDKISALWLWKDDLINKETGEIIEVTEDFLNFLNAPHGDNKRAINHLYIELPLNMLSDTNSSLKNFISKLNSAKNKIKVEVLLGNRGSWLWSLNDIRDGNILSSYEDGNGDELSIGLAIPKEYCEKIKQYNSSGNIDKEEKIFGIHFDIEPHAVGAEKARLESKAVQTEADKMYLNYLNLWWAKKGNDNYNDDMQNRFADLLLHCKNQFENETISVDFTTNYYHYSKELWDKITDEDLVNYIVIMNYITDINEYFQGDQNTDEIKGGVVNNLVALDSNPDTQVKLIFAFETIDERFAEDKASFFQEGFEVLHDFMMKFYNREVNQVLIKDNQKIAGVAIHHYKSYRYFPSCIRYGSSIYVDNLINDVQCIKRTSVDPNKREVREVIAGNNPLAFNQVVEKSVNVYLYPEHNMGECRGKRIGLLKCHNKNRESTIVPIIQLLLETK